MYRNATTMRKMKPNRSWPSISKWCGHWFASLVYYRININYAARLYLAGFVADLFGQCARSGFGDVWGFECLS